MATQPLIADERVALRAIVRGRVQGFGVRPLAARLATARKLCGRVANSADGLALTLEGEETSIRRFLADLVAALPAGSDVARIETTDIDWAGWEDFSIDETIDSGAAGAAVPLDRVVCPTCLAETRTAGNRRHNFPFTSCATCGPRYSLATAMPFDRAATSMERFALCAECGGEYASLGDRRGHAQTVSCPRCGPSVRLRDAQGRTWGPERATAAALEKLRGGGIVALKGIGGYQLLVDATSPDAVRRLRLRKRRQTKALAVLVGGLDEAERIALLNDAERRLLCSAEGPVVVAPRRDDCPLAREISPGFRTVGLMLPTTPLHALLCDGVGRPLVCTSGNREGEPLIYDDQRALVELDGIADAWLSHDRPIVRPIDDSVVRIVHGEPCVLRLGRGYAPHVLPPLPFRPPESIVALGGEQQASFALWNGSQPVLGPYIGDLSSSTTCRRWTEQLSGVAELYGIALPSAHCVHDRHPDYFSTLQAREFARRQDVQHHHAHIAAVLLEHGIFDRPVLGFAWDGTGYGDDGTVWGGECLVADCRSFRRVGRLRPFPLLGGDAAIREPWRLATTLVADAVGLDAAAALPWPDVPSHRTASLVDWAARPRGAVQTSSMGRLFDAVAALALGVDTADHEGRPAMLLEHACESDAAGSYRLDRQCATGELDWRPLIRQVVADRNSGVSPGAIAMRFHRALADAAADVAACYPHMPTATSGGVFQNAVLCELLAERWAERPAGWLRPVALPPGDGGLAAGQLAVGAARHSASMEANQSCA